MKEIAHDDLYQAGAYSLQDLELRIRGVPPDMSLMIYKKVSDDWKTVIMKMPLDEAKFFAECILAAIDEAPKDWILPESKHFQS